MHWDDLRIFLAQDQHARQLLRCKPEPTTRVAIGETIRNARWICFFTGVIPVRKYSVTNTRMICTQTMRRLFASMPEIVRALAAPLANVDKITIVSTGNGSAAGLNKITGDITQMAAQIPALFETLSGMPLSDLLGKVRQIGDKSPRPDGNGKSK